MILETYFNLEPILEQAGYTKLPGDYGFIKEYKKKDKIRGRFHVNLLSDFVLELHYDRFVKTKKMVFHKAQLDSKKVKSEIKRIETFI